MNSIIEKKMNLTRDSFRRGIESGFGESEVVEATVRAVLDNGEIRNVEVIDFFEDISELLTDETIREAWSLCQL